MQMKRTTHAFGIGLIAVALLGGCASSNPSTASPSSLSTASAASADSPSDRPCAAECLVCKKNADLACVDISVDKTTPTYAYNGKTYYFCSDECRNQFARNPTKYLSGK
jgi:YHS domain-containing protein